MHYCVCDYVSDIVQNSIEAGSLNIFVLWREDEDRLEITVSDDGCGMDSDTLEKALDPFYTDGNKHKGRKVGLGLPFLRQASETSGGKFEIESAEGEGTKVKFSFDLNNIDMPPYGNIKDTWVGLLSFTCDCELVIEKIGCAGQYKLSRQEISEAVGGFDWSEGMKLLREYIFSLETL